MNLNWIFHIFFKWFQMNSLNLLIILKKKNSNLFIEKSGDPSREFSGFFPIISNELIEFINSSFWLELIYSKDWGSLKDLGFLRDFSRWFLLFWLELIHSKGSYKEFSGFFRIFQEFWGIVSDYFDLNVLLGKFGDSSGILQGFF